MAFMLLGKVCGGCRDLHARILTVFIDASVLMQEYI